MSKTLALVAFVQVGFAGMAFALTPDPLAFLLASDSLGTWARVEPAVEYNKDNVFELINGEAELYFPYGLKRVVAADYATADDNEMTVSIEVYELATFLDAFGVYSNYRDEESRPVDVGTEGIGGMTQVMFYQDRFFAKVRTNKTDSKESLVQFARELSAGLPQQKSAPPEPGLLDVKGVIAMSRQYIAESVLGYEFFKRGLVAKAFVEEVPAEDVKPVRVFILMEKSPAEADKTIADYVAYLDEEQAAHQWAGEGDTRVLKAEDPLHKGVLIKRRGRHVIGVAKLGPDKDGLPLLQRLEEKLAAKR